MRRNKIAFVTDEFTTTLTDSGGLASYLQKQVSSFSEKGYEVHVLVRAEQSEQIKWNNVTIHHISPDWGHEMVLINFIRNRISKSLGRILTELRISYAISCYFTALNKHNGPFEIVQIADYMFRGLFIPIGTYLRIVRTSWIRSEFKNADNEYNNWSEYVLNMLEVLQLHRGDLLYCPSRFLLSYYQKEYDFHNLVYEAPQLPNVYFTEKTGLESNHNKPYFLHFGQISKRKGSDLVLQAVEILDLKNHRDFDILLIGMDRFNLISKYDSCKNLKYLGAQKRDVVNAYLKNCIAVILPSRIDNSPNTALESIACGKKIITVKNSSIDDLLEEFNSEGVVLEDFSAQELATVMLNEFKN